MLLVLLVLLVLVLLVMLLVLLHPRQRPPARWHVAAVVVGRGRVVEVGGRAPVGRPTATATAAHVDWWEDHRVVRLAAAATAAAELRQRTCRAGRYEALRGRRSCAVVVERVGARHSGRGGRLAAGRLVAGRSRRRAVVVMVRAGDLGVEAELLEAGAVGREGADGRHALAGRGGGDDGGGRGVIGPGEVGHGGRGSRVCRVRVRGGVAAVLGVGDRVLVAGLRAHAFHRPPVVVVVVLAPPGHHLRERVVLLLGAHRFGLFPQA